MVQILKWLRRKIEETTIEEPPMTIHEQLFKEIQKHCPECKKPPKWYEGPSGGMSMNIYCGHCGQGYNVSPPIKWAEKIIKDERYIDGSAN